MTEILLGVALFTAVVLLLSAVILWARAWLLPPGEIQITINDVEPFLVPAGGRLLQALVDHGLHLPQACGGVGACGLCRVRVLSGGGPILPVEREHISRRHAARGERLACQVPLRTGLEIHLPAAILGARKYTCTVRSTRQVAVLMRELVLDLPADASMDFRAGAFVLVTCPPFQSSYRDLDVDDAYRAEWERMGIRRLEAGASEPVTRAYSMANHPGEGPIVMLVVRLAIPPPGAPDTVPPGKVSSWLFGLRPGEEVTLSGPHGHFVAEESDREMVFVGGGAGMAPLRAHILAQLEHLHARRAISFWYGARTTKDLFYVDVFDGLARRHENFRWTAALSEPAEDEPWDGPTGFIHQVAHDRYLAAHPAPEDCVYYLCGPPVMVRATMQMLHDLGVATDHIHYDDFGG
ncbi:MAG: NADH:ubiquinone reductase (Na(+)-transporting) subunit F [Planctomycetota bacterium]